MPSLGTILSVASTGLRAHQEAINVTAHNIANASSSGYSVQRPVLTALSPLRTPGGVFGTGVRIPDVQRLRDTYLDAAYRKEASLVAGEEARAGVLGQIETLLGEPGEGGLGNLLDRFFSAWSALATHPTSAAARQGVVDQGALLAGRLRGLAAGLDRFRQDAQERLMAAVRRGNELAAEIAHLNREITAAEAGGHTAGDLRDARDRALDEMATLLPVQVVERENGSVGVLANGLSVVDGASHTPLEIRVSGGGVGVGLVGRPGLVGLEGGAVAGLLRLLNQDLPHLRARLDELAAALVAEVNAVHRTGTTPEGSTGVDFFDPAGVTAASISLSSAVAASPRLVAAGTGGAAGEYRAGVNDVALALAALRDTVSPSLGHTYGEHLRGLATGLGFALRSSLDLVEVHRTLREQAEMRRSSFSGVSTDEELVRLMEFQTAYAAAARVITAAQEMLETLVRL